MAAIRERIVEEDAAQDAPKRERLEARVSAYQRSVLQRAADIQGRSLSDFVIENAQRAAEDVIRGHSVIQLSVRDTVAFMDALHHPPAPSARLRAAAEQYKREVREL